MGCIYGHPFNESFVFIKIQKIGLCIPRLGVSEIWA